MSIRTHRLKNSLIFVYYTKNSVNAVSREAGKIPGSKNTGTGIEIVVDQGGTTGNKINYINK
ncbi:MAG TPA: hypothetical protein VLZ83_05310 [Edaphocola sp.]|nr:hypothetical protein [Edaphocola sp.]